MQQADPAAQTSWLAILCLPPPLSGSDRAPENQKYAIQEVCGEHLLRMVGSYRGLLCHSVLAIFEGLWQRWWRGSTESSWAHTQDCLFLFLTLDIHIHCEYMYFLNQGSV